MLSNVTEQDSDMSMAFCGYASLFYGTLVKQITAVLPWSVCTPVTSMSTSWSVCAGVQSP